MSLTESNVHTKKGATLKEKERQNYIFRIHQKKGPVQESSSLRYE